MKSSPVLEIKRSIDERLEKLISVYSPHGTEALKKATLRISRRLGPHRTKEALEALEEKDWRKACLAILNYYDHC